jgi:hypothetical protein
MWHSKLVCCFVRVSTMLGKICYWRYDGWGICALLICTYRDLKLVPYFDASHCGTISKIV